MGIQSWIGTAAIGGNFHQTRLSYALILVLVWVLERLWFVSTAGSLRVVVVVVVVVRLLLWVLVVRLPVPRLPACDEESLPMLDWITRTRVSEWVSELVMDCEGRERSTRSARATFGKHRNNSHTNSAEGKVLSEFRCGTKRYIKNQGSKTYFFSNGIE